MTNRFFFIFNDLINHKMDHMAPQLLAARLYFSLTMSKTALLTFVPLQGYRCLECGDAFALEQSLVRHYSRRSLRIEVTCNQCTKRLAFFNKCSLLLHAREHKEKGLIMQCSHLVMKPVPVEQMIGQPDSAALGW